MNNLNKELVGKNKHVFDMFSCITAFERKLRLWEVQIPNRNYSHFPNLQKQETEIKPDNFVSAIQDLRQELSPRFVDFRQYANAFKLFGTSCQTNVEEVEEKCQLELIDLQCDEFLKARYDSVSTVEFYQKYVAPRKKFPNLLQNAKIMTSLFAGKCCCEQLISKMKYTKSYLR